MVEKPVRLQGWQSQLEKSTPDLAATFNNRVLHQRRLFAFQVLLMVKL